ncbi:hypothetical protein E7T09_12970 [Deinococcus sp. KSM4-11]|uniref:hypothetical protein n=1 Tax=Deinococcus sp. KSM4-11 TaxID=2568654 RepID=UPI0010A59FB9|nr:hypothetical protein [Deinococcus sp. KSM4-11]THF86136.1 hypothetical protein E7T09_12970 [Deinococcus sp. KSM4-11]
MGNPNADPTKARQAKRAKRRAQPGTLEDARALLWRALARVGDILDGEGVEDATVLRALHGISQGAAAYARIVEVGELEARISALEAVNGEGKDTGPRLGRPA